MKQITVNVNPKDVRFVLKTLLSRAIERELKNRAELTQELDTEINNYQDENVKEILIKILEAQNQSSNEITEAARLLEHLGSPDTEVLEDLSDLKEDGLGVDDGSE